MRPTEIKIPFDISPIGNKDWKTVLDTGIKELGDFNWQLGFGTLLGIVREGRALPHDIDIDISILITEEDAQPKIQELKNKIEAAGFTFIRSQHFGDKIMSLAFQSPQNIILDFCMFYGCWGDDLLHLGINGIVIRPRYSLKTIQKDGYNIPKEYDRFLTGRYGNWKVEKKDKEHWYEYADKYFIPYD